MMTVSTTFTFTKAALHEDKTSFETSADPFFSEVNQAHLRAAIERVKRTGGTEHEMIDD
jgi:DNA-damage-inducible protein J